jgi:hypothetical protein
MGVYIYTLRKPMRPIMLHGEPVMAALFKFLRKPHFDLGQMDRTSAMLTAKATSLFTEVPKYAVLEDWKTGSAVYRWKGGAWCYDEPRFPGYHVGDLKVTGRGKLQSLEVEALAFAHMPLKMVEPGYAFRFGEVGRQLFNKATGKDFTLSDVFDMHANGIFRNGAQEFAVYRLPAFAGEWGVVVDIRPNVDMTNMLEAQCS